MPASLEKVVLSHPFSGALYAFFSEKGQGRSVPEKARHPYYRTLYGDHFRKLSDLALTLTVLFDSILLSPADHWLPDFASHSRGGDYSNPNLGLYTSWNEWSEVSEEIESRVSGDLSDASIAAILRSVPPISRKQILTDARFEIYLARRNDCPIVCSQGRRGIIERILKREAMPNQPNTIAAPSLELVEQYIEVTGLVFQPATLDDLYDLKTDRELRSYASSFRTAMQHFENSKEVRRELLIALQKAMNISSLAKRATGIFDTAGTILNVAGLVPIVGTVASALGLATSAGEVSSRRISMKQQWIEFGPQVARIRSLNRIRKLVQNELRRDENRGG
jgi:hypothetical protein